MPAVVPMFPLRLNLSLHTSLAQTRQGHVRDIIEPSTPQRCVSQPAQIGHALPQSVPQRSWPQALKIFCPLFQRLALLVHVVMSVICPRDFLLCMREHTFRDMWCNLEFRQPSATRAAQIVRSESLHVDFLKCLL